MTSARPNIADSGGPKGDCVIAIVCSAGVVARIVTAAIGAPLQFYLLVRRNREVPA